jgi:hypothetical protein
MSLCWESFCCANHLFEPSEMVDWHLHHGFLEDVVSPRLHVNVLHVPRLFYFSVHWIKSWSTWWKFSSKLQSCATGTGIVTSMGSGKCVWSTYFQAVLCWPWSTFFELHKGVWPGEVTFFSLFVEFRDFLSMVNLMPHLLLSLWILARLLLPKLLLWSL